MSEKKTRKKNQALSSDDIRVDRKAVTKVIMSNSDNPSVIEINISMFAIPNQERDREDYEGQIERITRYSNRLLRRYVTDNQNLFEKRCILDINFTSANLKKGYNKSVQMSLFVRQNYPRKMSRIKAMVKDSIKDTVNQITSRISDEDFRCYKRKQATNKKLNA